MVGCMYVICKYHNLSYMGFDHQKILLAKEDPGKDSPGYLGMTLLEKLMAQPQGESRWA